MLQYITKGIALCFLCGVVFVDSPATIRVTQGDGTALGNEDTERADSKRKWTARRIERDGGVLRLLVPEEAASIDLPLNVIIENRGKGRLLCGETGYFLDCVVTLTSKDGGRVPYSQIGRAVFSHVEDRKQYAHVTFTPGQLRSWEFNLADAFEPLKKGEYVLTLEAAVRLENPKTKEFTDRVQMIARDVSIVVTSKNAARE